MVDRDGQRFVDEGADLRNHTYAKYGREILAQPDHRAYQIFDTQVRAHLRPEYNRPEATVFQADTLEALADALDIDRGTFLQTIAKYNAAVNEDMPYDPTRKDGRGTPGLDLPKSNWALKIEQGLFYAFPVTCGVTFAFSGVHASPNGEVLKADNAPIPGLCAAGEMIGGLFSTAIT